MLYYVYVSHRRRKHGGHSSHAKDTYLPIPLPTHTLTKSSSISSNYNTLKSGTDFDGEKQEAASLDSRRLNYFAKPKVYLL